MKEDIDISKIIPSTVFGLGLLFSSGKLDIKLLKVTTPYLLLSILFGTIIPYFIIHNNFKNTNLKQLIISKTLLYISETLAFTFLIPSIIIPFLIM